MIRYSAKLTTIKRTTINNAIAKLNEYYRAVLAVWHLATPEQKAKFIENSPLLKAIMDWSDQWRQ